MDVGILVCASPMIPEFDASMEPEASPLELVSPANIECTYVPLKGGYPLEINDWLPNGCLILYWFLSSNSCLACASSWRSESLLSSIRVAALPSIF